MLRVRRSRHKDQQQSHSMVQGNMGVSSSRGCGSKDIVNHISVRNVSAWAGDPIGELSLPRSQRV